MKLTPEERIQGLLDEHAAGLSRAGIKAKCEFFMLQGRMTEAEADALLKLIDDQDAASAPVSIVEKLATLDAVTAERDTLAAERETLAKQVSLLQAAAAAKGAII